MEARIRPAHPDDAAAIHDVSWESWHEAYDGILGADTVETVIDEWYALDRVRAAIDRTIFHVAAKDDRILGFANAEPNPEYEEGMFELSRIYVRPAYWNRGIGGRLLDTVMDAVRQQGGTELRLKVLANNDVGVGFYEANGFERIDTVSVELGGEEHDEYVYRRSIDSPDAQRT